jgi:Raf kinase inhibitor-like YbhB/YbcL family protein
MRPWRLTCVAALALAATLSEPAAAMSLTSPDIKDGGAISAAHIYTRCGGQNISPALSWAGQPAAARSLVLTVIDIDVKPALWSHWIVTGLPVTTTSLPRGVSALPAGAHAVASNFGDDAYDGPCPPAGSGVHHYQFTIWAMPTADVAIGDDASASDVLAKLTSGAIAHASLAASVER